MALRVDVHQHLWTEGLCGALAARAGPPRLRQGDGGWVLELVGETPFPLPAALETPADRVARLGALGADAALLALSSALGVETLHDDEARAVLAAWDADADALPVSLAAWGAVPLAAPDAADVDAALARGRVGITLPAGALATPAALDRVEPLLDRLAAAGAPLLVHPGPAPPGAWLPALTSYLAELQAAWHAWVLHGRARHPSLRVLFAALAGLAPLHAERLAARGHPTAARAAVADAGTFYDTSSYGPLATGALAGAVGERALLRGSDWPYATPAPDAVAAGDPAELLGGRYATLRGCSDSSPAIAKR